MKTELLPQSRHGLLTLVITVLLTGIATAIPPLLIVFYGCQASGGGC